MPPSNNQLRDGDNRFNIANWPALSNRRCKLKMFLFEIIWDFFKTFVTRLQFTSVYHMSWAVVSWADSLPLVDKKLSKLRSTNCFSAFLECFLKDYVIFIRIIECRLYFCFCKHGEFHSAVEKDFSEALCQFRKGQKRKKIVL